MTRGALEGLAASLNGAGIRLTEGKNAMLSEYAGMLMEWNTRMNLTNVPEKELASRHFADSLLPLAEEGLFPVGAALIDVGTGAGFPGLPLAIAREDLAVCLLESHRKRCLFLEEVCGQLKLRNVRVVCGRAEIAAKGVMRESFDIATARAVAPVRVLAEYMLPFLKPGGRMLCWKGPAVRPETDAAEGALRILGGKEEKLISLPMPGRESFLLAIEKTDMTPAGYPRRPGVPAKNPL